MVAMPIRIDLREPILLVSLPANGPASVVPS